MMIVEVLSLKSIKTVLDFMLDTALDQIKYMSSVIKIDLIAKRMSNYVEFSQKKCMKILMPLQNILKRYLNHC